MKFFKGMRRQPRGVAQIERLSRGESFRETLVLLRLALNLAYHPAASRRKETRLKAKIVCTSAKCVVVLRSDGSFAWSDYDVSGLLEPLRTVHAHSLALQHATCKESTRAVVSAKKFEDPFNPVEDINARKLAKVSGM
eukprot:1814319-Amphidinium_carterae.2